METFRTSFEHTLAASDSKKNIPFTIQVPAGTTRIHILFTYAPPIVDEIRNMLTLTVFDPSGWRGAGHRHGDRHEVLLDETQASPGYLIGPVQPGTWTVVVDTHMVMPGPPCILHLEVSGSDEVIEHAQMPLKAGHTASRGPGWYRGDLHAHTFHSDAVWDVPKLLDYARSQHLDFTTLSDHNTVSGLPEMDAASADDLLTMGGMELTTFWGHALALGLRDWVDWRVCEDERTMEQIAADVTARGGVFIIAHPKEMGDPICTGCRWLYPTMMPGSARVVEIWNTDWGSESKNEEGLELVFGWLNQGSHLALTAGTDNHGFHPELMDYGFNVVYAEDLSEKEVLRAVRAGHLYISTGPTLEFEAEAGGQRAMMGDVLKAAHFGPLKLRARWKECAVDARLELIVDGKTRENLPAGESNEWTCEIQSEQAHWCLLTLRSADGGMLALTNPIYLDGRA